MKKLCSTFVFVLLIIDSLCGIYANKTNNFGISVSGISSGGFMAVQFHVAYSSSLRGAGIVAGGPYWCANANIAIATTSCMKYPHLISVTELIAATEYAEGLYSIDDTQFLKSSKVWLFSGTEDTIVDPGVVKKLEQYYQYYVDSSNIKTVYNYSAEHAYPTKSFGNACNFLGSPFINNCGFDAAGSILEHIYGTLRSPVAPKPENVITLKQSNFIPVGYTAETASLYAFAYAYIPTACNNRSTSCSLHVAFHGCEQTIEDIGDIFYKNAGYNEWAESNGIIILYPQASSNVLNPNGCFDWWGFTGADYATKLGAQMATVKSMVDFLTATYL